MAIGKKGQEGEGSSLHVSDSSVMPPKRKLSAKPRRSSHLKKVKADKTQSVKQKEDSLPAREIKRQLSHGPQSSRGIGKDQKVIDAIQKAVNQTTSYGNERVLRSGKAYTPGKSDPVPVAAAAYEDDRILRSGKGWKKKSEVVPAAPPPEKKKPFGDYRGRGGGGLLSDGCCDFGQVIDAGKSLSCSLVCAR
jgi:hypothetical protein